VAVQPLAPDLVLVDCLARWRIADVKDQAQTLDVPAASRPSNGSGLR